MNLKEANIVWKKLLKIMKDEHMSLNIALENTEVTKINKNIWEIVIYKDISPSIRRELFKDSNVKFIRDFLKEKVGEDIVVEYNSLSKIMDYGLDKETFLKVSSYLRENKSLFLFDQIKIYSDFFYSLCSIVKKKILIDDLIRSFFQYVNLHNIKYYRNERYINIYVAFTGKKEYISLTKRECHIISLIFYYIIYDAQIKLDDFDFIKENLNSEESILNIYENNKNKEKYSLSDDLITTEEEEIKDSMEELQSMIGLDRVKEDVISLINLNKIDNMRRQQGLARMPITKHMVFTGNPGTGKTTVARLIAKIYKDMGILKSGHLVETDRSGLVGQYIGETALKTKEVIKSAIGGILFIDEAYSLARYGDDKDFGKEAIDTLVKEMEDNRDNLVVIVAGYSKEMKDFINMNPGLKSRFKNIIEFPDYSIDELIQILVKMCNDYVFYLTEEALVYIKERFQEKYKILPRNFSNAREIRNYLQQIQINQANRLAKMDSVTRSELTLLTLEDVEGVV